VANAFLLLEADAGWLLNALALLSVPALVVLNGLFVAAEFSLVAVRKTRVEELVEQGVKSARAVEASLTNMDRTIAATQLGITLASIGLGFVGEPVLARLLEGLFGDLAAFLGTAAIHSIAVGLAFLLITFMHVVFGELIPKTMSLQAPDRTALWIARPLVVFTQLTRPLTLVMKSLANVIVGFFGFKPASGEQMVHSVQELTLLIEDTEEAGILGADQAEYVTNVFRLSDKHVGDCLVPRDKMATLELFTAPDKVLEAARTGAHTRMPVYEGELDRIVGIVNTKDLFYLFSLRGVCVLEDALYPAVFLQPDSTMAEALRLFQKSHRHMALVRDPEGKIHGLITLEDVLEEIIGDIEDEHDRPTPKKLVISRARQQSKPPVAKPNK
jgi:CBS domain containing-hemolysin-like protein